MKIYEPTTDLYEFKLLPSFAAYIRDTHLESFVAEQLKTARALSLPVLKHISHLSDADLINFGKKSAYEFLTFIANNQAREQIAISMQRWLDDNLSIINRYSVAAEDITGINHTRSESMKKLIDHYDTSNESKFALAREIDRFFFGAITTGMNMYAEILKNKIESEAHLNAQLISTSPGIIFIFDLQTNKEIYINGNVQHVMGYTAEEVLSMESNILSMLTHPEDLPSLQHALQKLLLDRSGHSHEIEYRFKHKDGSYRWLRSYSLVFKRDLNGFPLEVLGTSFEITAEKEMKMALAKRESQLLEAQAIAQLGSFEWNIAKDESANTPELLKIFEIGVNQSLVDFLNNVHPLDKDRLQKAMAESLTTGTLDCQYRYVINNHEKVLWTRGRVTIKNGEPTIMRGTVQDITQLKRIEEELIRKTRELERSNESLQQFASIASHDLKEPLRKMSMYTDMVMTMEEKSLTEDSQNNLNKVKASSIRMQNMIDDILNFSTITNTEQRRPLNLEHVILEVISLLDQTISEKSAKINFNNLPTVRIIPAQFRQLFQNLLSNALKFSKSNNPPVIHITHRFLTLRDLSGQPLEPAERYVELTVKDNGIGFRQEQAQKIFGLFARLHGRGSYEGTGLGLAICKRIVENHGGSIRAESDLGKGAAFIITIPS